MARRAGKRLRRRLACGSAALIAVTGLVAVFGLSTAGAEPQQIPCPSGSPSGSFCGQFGPGEPAPPGGEQIDCPAGAPEGSTCYRFSGGPGGQPPGGSEPPGGGGGPGGCSTKDGPVELTSVKADGKEILDQLCPQVMYQEQGGPGPGPAPSSAQAGLGAAKAAGAGGMPMATILLQLKDGGQFAADVGSLIPAGTPVELTAKMGPEPVPLMVIGTLNVSKGKVTIAEDGTVTATGKAAKVNFAFTPGQCPGQEMVFIGMALMGEPDGASQFTGLEAYRGFWAFGNMQGISFGGTGSGGAEPSVTVDGCNLDTDPDTLDGFLTAFLPTKGYDQMGVDPAALAAMANLPKAAENLAIDTATDVKDNNTLVPPDNLDFEATNQKVISSRAGASQQTFNVPAGILVDVTFSFSQHKISASANRKGAALVNRCAKSKKKKLKVVKRGGERVLVCVKKKRKR